MMFYKLMYGYLCSWIGSCNFYHKKRILQEQFSQIDTLQSLLKRWVTKKNKEILQKMMLSIKVILVIFTAEKVSVLEVILVRIFSYSVRMRENTDQNNSK